MPIFSLDGPERAVHLQRAGELLRNGELVAFPTETVYGLGANALDADAVAKIFAAKGRPSFNPLIVHVSDAEAAQKLVTAWPEAAQKLAAQFWPGPLSLVLPKNARVPDNVSAGLDSVALRAPSHSVAQSLLRAAGVPLAAPSANRFTELSPVRATHVESALGERVAMILDGGACEVGIESTVLSLVGAPVLLRPGTITKHQIEAVIGPISVAAEIHGDAPRAAPGMIERHYAPRARLHIFDSAEEIEHTPNDGAILLDEVLASRFAHALILPRDVALYARGLYDALHLLDALGCKNVWLQQVPASEEWRGVRDRLSRAVK
ncbi:MAG TPA: L-threonylcarbamoyladenylate synthase [Abditibacteriaceae bacterium]|jgi:L-threonylcarbamoyladenylate synthase